MPSTPVQPIIIIKKRKKGHEEHHGGAWKVAYADFVTAMMALFIVLWLLNSSEKLQKAVGGYFQDPQGIGKMMGSAKAGVGEDLEVKKEDLSELKKKIQAAMSKQVRNFDNLRAHVILTITEEGLRVELTESEKGTFFQSGSPMPTSAGSEILGLLGAQLGELPNKIVVEGHTDSSPFARGEDYSNWELSADRANTVRRLMHRKGLRDDQVMQVRGFADLMLKKPDAPEDPSNRRVSVIIRYQNSGELPAVLPGAQVSSEHGVKPPLK